MILSGEAILKELDKLEDKLDDFVQERQEIWDKEEVLADRESFLDAKIAELENQITSLQAELGWGLNK